MSVTRFVGSCLTLCLELSQTTSHIFNVFKLVSSIQLILLLEGIPLRHELPYFLTAMKRNYVIVALNGRINLTIVIVAVLFDPLQFKLKGVATPVIIPMIVGEGYLIIFLSLLMIVVIEIPCRGEFCVDS